MLLACGAATQAQDEPQPSEVELFTQRYTASVDSLMRSYYLRHYREAVARHDRHASIDDFDHIPDSVIIRRLTALHTVIPMTYNQEVRSYIRMYLKYMSKRLDVMLTLGEFYHPLFEDVLSHYGVPEELKYLTIVESAMNPNATSRMGAAGLWQFMYSTGKRFDLEVNSVVDNRRDVHRSTVAAARYLAELHDRFDDWQLAIAAYNCGSGNISKAIARSGGKQSFWEIYPYLPRETRGYVPAFIAVVYVMNYYPEHGLRPERVSSPIQVDTVGVSRDVLFPFVTEATGVSDEELRTLNPQYRIGYVPATTGTYALTLPADKVELFLAHEDSVYARTADSLSRRPVKVEAHKGSGTASGSGKYHTVRNGETLSKIAAKYGISVATLKKRNGLKSDKLRVGQRLRIR